MGLADHLHVVEVERRGTEGRAVIDADAHMHEPRYLWERYVEPKYRDRVPKVAFMDGNRMVYEPDGKIIKKGELQQGPAESATRSSASGT